MKRTDNTIKTDFVNFDKFAVQRKEVILNGKQLPLSIGDKIKLADNEKMNKTVVGISIYEDGRVSYMLEWYDPESGQFNNEAVTLTELKLLNANIKKIKAKTEIGFK